MTDQEPQVAADEKSNDSAVHPAQASASPVHRPVNSAPHSRSAERPSFIYAVGHIEPRFPSLAVEKEFAQVVGRAENSGYTDRQAFKTAISDRDNRYLARSLCWVLVIEALETYILVPRDPTDLDLLIDSYREEPRRDDLDVVVGVRGPIAPPDMCNGMAIPIVVFDQIYSFDRDSLIDSIPLPDSVDKKNEAKFRSTAGGLLDQLMQLADNAGAIDEHRALNYLMVRYPQIYATTTAQYDRNFSFTGVEVRPSLLSGVRSIVDVIFSYRHRETDVVEKQYARVDVTEEFQFLVTKLSPFYDR